MWDYSALESFEAIVRTGSFQSAARELHVTQSAISQRLHNLEEQVGAPLVIRGQPLRTTRIGSVILDHVRKTQRLEESLALSLQSEQSESFVRLTLGVNGDSLATWFFEAIAPLLKEELLLLDLIIENEGITFARLQKGEVLGCISSRSKKLSGCEVEKLGSLVYRCASTPEFKQKYFPRGLQADALRSAPAVRYDDQDSMHSDFFRKYFDLHSFDFPFHSVATSPGFLDTIRHGIAYGMAPTIQAEKDFDSGALVNLAPRFTWKQDLYWHHQRREDPAFKRLSRQFVINSRRLLREG